jgi:hypothetical protein
MNSEKDQLCTQSPQQLDAGLTRPEDFEPLSGEAARSLQKPFHGQCGENDREYERLVKEAGQTSKGPITGKGAPRPIQNVSQGVGKPTKPVQQK